VARLSRNVTAYVAPSKWSKRGRQTWSSSPTSTGPFGRWVGEKVARLKLNGQLRGYSPLSRVVELEALSVGVAGKLALWQSLASVPALSERLSGFDLDQLAERARRQRTEIEEQRVNAARETFGSR
jgi:hypothetical protein